jgi:predicted RNA-binding Zn ribbon-like protein
MADNDFLWIGNHPATDLCNTRPVIDGDEVELLTDLEALAAWTRRAGIASDVSLDEIADGEAAATVRFVHRLRDALREVLEGGGRDADAVEALDAVVGEEGGRLRVTIGASEPVGLAAPTPAAQLRLDVALAALDILHHDLRLVRRCANPVCVLLFLDLSKSGRRRWCSMSVCGNRAKVAAHYARTTGRRSGAR